MPDVTHELAAQSLLPDSPAGDAAIARAVLAVTRATRESAKCLDDIGNTLAEVLIYMRSYVEVRDGMRRLRLIRVGDAWVNPDLVASVSADSNGDALVQVSGAASLTIHGCLAVDAAAILTDSVFA